MNLKNNINYHSRLRRIIIVMFLLFILVSCGKNNGTNGENEYFLFDSSKLGIEVADHDLGIKFLPPKNWNLRPTSISKKVESRGASENQSENFVYQPIYVFFSDSTSGLLSVGKVVTSDSTIAQSAKINYYKSLLSTKYKTDNLSSADFMHSKIYFHQIRFNKHNLVSTKVFFENTNHEIIQFDYTIPSSYLEGTEDFIKSSLGSIKPF